MIRKATVLVLSFLILPLFIGCSSDTTPSNQSPSTHVQKAVVSFQINQRLDHQTLESFAGRLTDRFRGACNISRDKFRVNRTNTKTNIDMEVECYESGISRDDIKNAVRSASNFSITSISVK